MKTRVGPLGDDDMMWHVLFVAECRRWARVRRLAAKSGRRRGSSRRWERMRRLHWIVLQEMYHYQSHQMFLKSLQRWEAFAKKIRDFGEDDFCFCAKAMAFIINRHDPNSLQAATGASQPEGPSTETVVMVSDAPMWLDLTGFWARNEGLVSCSQKLGGGHLKCIEMYRV